jgi:precorrin-6B methylase 1
LLVKTTLAIARTSMSWTDSSTIRALRQVTTETDALAHDAHRAAVIVSKRWHSPGQTAKIHQCNFPTRTSPRA